MDDLERAQSSLGRALGRARAGEDRELAQRVRELGEQLSRMLSGLLNLTKLHDPSNRAFDAPVAEFGHALSALVDLLGTVHLVTVEDQVYVNDVRARDEGNVAKRDLGGALRRHNVGGISFHAPLDSRAIRLLVAELAASPAPEGPRASLGAALREGEAGTVELHGIFRFQQGRTAERAVQRDPGELLARMLALVTETWNNLSAGRALNPLPLRRAVVEMIDAGIEAPPFWLAYPEAPVHVVHAVQVCATAQLLGKAAGLHLAFLQDLGIAALTHDAGYLGLSPDEAEAPLARHAFEGARMVIRQRGFSEAKVRRLRAVMEHHRDYTSPEGTPSLGGALLRVAEDYVNGVRLYGERTTRARILGAMLAAAGRVYHPILPRLLVNALGRHPPGTLLELEGGLLGRVAAPARGPELWDRPLLRRLDPATRGLTGEWIDLALGTPVVRVLPG